MPLLHPTSFAKEWKDTYGGKCAILGNGPSLPHWRRLAKVDCFKIGLERAFWATDELDCLVVVDPQTMSEHRADFVHLTPHTVLRMSKQMHPDFITPKWRYWNQHGLRRSGQHFNTDIAKHGWVHCCGLAPAIQLAFYLGFREIVLLGVDLRHVDGEKHFYGVDRNCHLDYMQAQVEWLQEARPVMDELGIRLISCTLDSAERTSEKIPFDEVFP